jgi:beta-lactam-binding protein with PASTA domain
MKNIFVLAVAALALAVFAVPAQAQQVTVPNVVGMTTDQAVKTLEAAGLRGPIGFEVTANQAQHGKVTKQNPAAGQKAVKGSGVVLTAYMYQAPAVKVTVAPAVTAAFGETVMPLVYGKTYAEAKAALEKAGLSYDKATKEYTLVRTRDDKLIAGEIREQRPAAGTRIAKTTQVWLRGYSYKPPPNVTVPDVRNLPFDDAMKKLQALGLHVGGGSTATARKELDRKVADQRPAAGTIVPGETQVHLTYWLYAESALEVKAQFMPEAKTYLLMVRGGALPYDVVASYDVPKNMAGQKIVRITPLTDSPGSPGWKLYRITNQIPVEAVMVVTDAKGRKHNYKLHLTQANK